jgi:hypothetical protein
VSGTGGTFDRLGETPGWHVTFDAELSGDCEALADCRCVELPDIPECPRSELGESPAVEGNHSRWRQALAIGRGLWWHIGLDRHATLLAEPTGSRTWDPRVDRQQSVTAIAIRAGILLNLQRISRTACGRRSDDGAVRDPPVTC